MKKIFLLFASLMLCCSVLCAAEKQREIHVNNPVEFIQALGSDRIVIVDWDIDFNDELTEIHNFNQKLLPTGDKYDENIGKKGEKCFIYNNTDGPELVLAGYKNLTIKGESKRSRTLLRIRPRYAYVLNFINCQDIHIENLVMGHTDEGYCDGGVLSFDYCQDIHIDNCDLYGCGTEGIGSRQTERLTMTNSQIRDCSYQIMTLNSCKDFMFERCFFFRNRQYSLFNIHQSSNIHFLDCNITHNEGPLFNTADNEALVFEKCNIMHSIENRGIDYDVLYKQCCITDEYGVKRDKE